VTVNRVWNVLRVLVAGLGALFAAIAVYLILQLSATTQDQNRQLDRLIEADARKTAIIQFLRDREPALRCRLSVEQDLLIAFGENDAEALAKSIDRLKQINDDCPLPDPP
jgi:hypothetical protein